MSVNRWQALMAEIVMDTQQFLNPLGKAEQTVRKFAENYASEMQMSAVETRKLANALVELAKSSEDARKQMVAAVEADERRAAAVNDLWQELLKQRDADEAAAAEAVERARRFVESGRAIEDAQEKQLENSRRLLEHERKLASGMSPAARAEAEQKATEALAKEEEDRKNRFIAAGKAIEDAQKRQIENARRQVELAQKLSGSASPSAKRDAGLAANADAYENAAAEVQKLTEAEERLAAEREANRQRFIAAAEAIQASQERQITLTRNAVAHETQQRKNAAAAASLAAQVAERNEMEYTRAVADGTKVLSMRQAQILSNIRTLQAESQVADLALLETGRGIKKNTMMWFEFGRGIEDASIGYSLNGIKGLVMGASNNLARMAEMAGAAGGALARFGPYVAIIVSLGTAVYTLWQNWMGTKEATDDAKEELEEYIKELEYLLELEGRRVTHEQELQEFATGAEAGERLMQLDAEIEKQEALAEAAANQADASKDAARSLQQDLDAMRAEFGPLEGRLSNPWAFVSDEDIDRFNELRQQMNGLDEVIDQHLKEEAAAEERVRDIDNEILVLVKERTEVQERYNTLSELENDLHDAALQKLRDEEMAERRILEAEEERLRLANLRQRQEEEDQRRADRMEVSEELRGILDPTGAAVNDVLRQSFERSEVLKADETLSGSEFDALMADNMAATERQIEELFDVDRLREQFTEVWEGLDAGIFDEAQVAGFIEQLTDLQTQFSEGTISIDDFTEGMDAVQQGMDEAAEAAREAAEAAEEAAEEERRRQAIMAGDFAGAGLDFNQAMEDRLVALRMREWNEIVDAQFEALYGNRDKQKQWEAEMERLHKAADKAADALNEFQGDPQEAMGNLWDYINSLPGQIANTENTLAMLQNSLDMFGDTMDSFARMQLEDRIVDLTDVLRDLYDLQASRQFLTGEMNGPAFITDPGLRLPGDRGGGSGPRGGTVLEFPNVTRLTNSDIGQVSDRLMEENRRRGVRI